MNRRPAETPAPTAGNAGEVEPPGMENALYEVPLLIAGRDVPASQGATFERRHPVTGAVASRAASTADAVAAARAAQEAFPAWSGLGPTARRAALLRR